MFLIEIKKHTRRKTTINQIIDIINLQSEL